MSPERTIRDENMGSSLAKINVHLIFHIKTSSVKIQKKDLSLVFGYTGGIITNIGGVSMVVGGCCDHVHILASLPKTMSLADFVRVIKSSSSKWIKTIGANYKMFSWQDGYGAFSVSPTLLEKTMKYICFQEEHHNKQSIREEYKTFLDVYQIEYDDRYILND